jgi:nitroimidazol reductase NimA-like FMN-containing flavoprotein (pyridoxamine 5'-phosphate oxidase superfamily)
MRRKEREITDIEEIEAIIERAEVCRLALAVDNTPYIVPVNYGYEDRCLYIHCATEGRKLDMIRQNSTVCFEMDVDVEIVDGGDVACKWGTTYRSVIGYGEAFIVEDFDDKKGALEILMKHYTGKTGFEYTDKSIETVGIIKIEVTHLSGKQTL